MQELTSAAAASYRELLQERLGPLVQQAKAGRDPGLQPSELRVRPAAEPDGCCLDSMVLCAPTWRAYSPLPGQSAVFFLSCTLSSEHCPLVSGPVAGLCPATDFLAGFTDLWFTSPPRPSAAVVRGGGGACGGR